jgi:hypothetical protein
VTETPTGRQAQAARARRAFLTKFSSPEAKTEYFRELARRSHERRLTLRADETAALAHAVQLLTAIVARAQSGDGVVREEAASVA